MDIVLNSIKHNVDDIYALPDNQADHKLTEVLAMTLGFKIKRNYDQVQLRALAVVLPRILKYKGTKYAVDIAGRALLAASGASGSYRSEVRDGELYVIFPETLVDITLFNDLLVYILPAGMTCHVARTDILEAGIQTIYDYNERLIAQWLPDVAWDDDAQVSVGLSNMFDIPAEQPIFSNFDSELAPNIGLLDNSVIPMLNNVLISTNPKREEPDYTTEENEYGTTVVVNKYISESDGESQTAIIGEEDQSDEE
jgi:hypothetical protein